MHIAGDDKGKPDAAALQLGHRFRFRYAHQLEQLIENASVLFIRIPSADAGRALRPQAVQRGKVPALFQRPDKSRPAAGIHQLPGGVQPDLRNAQRIQKVHGIRPRPRPFHRREQILAAALSEALQLLNLPGIAVEAVQVRKAVDKAEAHEITQSLDGQAVDVGAALADKALELLQVLGRAVRVIALQRTGPAGSRGDAHRRLAGRTVLRKCILSDGAGDAHHLGDDLVGFDDLDLGFAVLPDAEAVHLAEVHQRSPGYRCPLQLHRVEDRDRRDHRRAAGPLHLAQGREGRLVLPFEGIARPRRMVAGHAARGRIDRIVIADDQAVHRDLHLAALHPARPLFHGRRQPCGIGQLAVHRDKAEPVQPVHLFAP